MPPGHAQPRRKAILAATALIGLLLAVAGVMPGGTGVDLPASFAIDLPAWLIVPFFVLLVLHALGVFILMATGVRQRGRLPERQKRNTLVPLLWLFALLLLWIELREHQGIDIFQTLRTFFETGFAPRAPVMPDPEAPPPVPAPLLSSLVQALLLALALLLLAVMAWIYVAFLPSRMLPAAMPAERAAFQEAVQESLDDLRALPDARLAILRCYERFERLLADASVGRSPWQTALEFMRTTLRYPWLPQGGVRELTALFELARFSQHALGPPERERAWQALMAVKAALDKESLNAA
jgi:hypothetical protein